MSGVPHIANGTFTPGLAARFHAPDTALAWLPLVVHRSHPSHQLSGHFSRQPMAIWPLIIAARDVFPTARP